MRMYLFMLETAGRLWAGTDPSEVTLDNEYLRGQVELIIEMGVSPHGNRYDHDDHKKFIATAIRYSIPR